MTTLAKHLSLIADCFENPHDLSIDRLNEFQREKLAAAAMRDMGDSAYEAVTNPKTLDDITGKLILALEASPTDRKEILQEIGELLVKGALEETKSTIEHAIDDELMRLSMARQFYPEFEDDCFIPSNNRFQRVNTHA